MSEKKVCSEYNENELLKIILPDFVSHEVKIVERFLQIVAKHDEDLIEKLLIKYKENLSLMGLNNKPNILLKRYNLNYAEYKLMSKYSKYIPLIENATLKFLAFSKYHSQFEKENEIQILLKDSIRGEFYPLYYLAYALMEITSQEEALQISREFNDLSYEIIKEKLEKAESLEDWAKYLYYKGCLKTHNFISLVKDGRYFLKVTKCYWGVIYAELPDLKLASMLECYGDFAGVKYHNPNFVLTRKQTLVEGYPYCDFCYHDKRLVKEIKHPDKKFWNNFK